MSTSSAISPTSPVITTGTEKSIRSDSPIRSSKEDYDIDDGDTFFELLSIHLDQPVGSMSMSPANRDVALGARKGLFIVDLQNPYDPPRFLPHNSSWEVADVQWNPFPCRSEWVVSTSNQKAVVYNLSLSPSLSASPIEHTLHAHTRAVTDINWSPASSEILATSALDGRVWAWDLRTGYGSKSGKGGGRRPVWGVCSWGSGATQVKWNRREPHIIASSHDNHVLIWDDRMGAAPITTIRGHSAKIYGIDWSRESPTELVTCSLDKTFKSWSILDTASPSLTVLTSSPVWRARYLPFGRGVLTLPQRSDHALSIWARHDIEASAKSDSVVVQPVARFLGATAGVKEFVWRTRGGNDLDKDDREFQLITWAKDRRLRLWPISEEILKGVNHVKGGKITVPVTRRNGPNISYRSFSENAPPTLPLAFPTQRVNSPNSLAPPNMLSAGPSLLTSSLLSAGFTAAASAAESITPTPISIPVRRGAATMTTTSVRNKRQKAHDRLAWMEGVQRLLPGATQAVMEESKMEVERGETRSSSLVRGTDGTATAREGADTERESVEGESRTTAIASGRDATHANLGEEITSVVRRFQRVNFEKMNISGRTCTVSLYTPLFIRATFNFPKNYPHSAPPTIEIEKTADIPGRSRAFLLQNVRRLMLGRCIHGLPSLEVALRFLLGDREKKKDESESEDDDEDDVVADRITAEILRRNSNTPPPRRGGAIFGPRGQLIVFFPTNVLITTVEKEVNPATSRMVSTVKKKSQPRLSEVFGYLTNLDGAQDRPEDGYQETDEALQMPRGPTFRSLVGKLVPAAPTSTPSAPLFSSIVHVKNVSHLVLLRPSSPPLLFSTVSSPLVLAQQALESARGAKDAFHARLWTTLVTLFESRGGRSAETILAERIVAELLRYLVHLREIQTVGQIACLLELHRQAFLQDILPLPLATPLPQTPMDYFSHHRISSHSPLSAETPNALLTPTATKRHHSPKPSWTNLAGLFNSSVLSLRSSAHSPSGTIPATPSPEGMDTSNVSTRTHTPTSLRPSPTSTSLRTMGSSESVRTTTRPALSRQPSTLGLGRTKASPNVSFGGTRVQMIPEIEGQNDKKKPGPGKRILVHFDNSVGFGGRPPWWLSPAAQLELELLRLGYAALLERWQEDQARLAVLKLCSSGNGYASTLVRAGNGLSDRVGLRMVRKCSECGGVLLEAERACSTCRRRPRNLKCVLCHLPVLQLAQSCNICLHVGHLDCMKSWYDLAEGCPTGCGCSCSVSGGLSGVFLAAPPSTPIPTPSPNPSIPSPTIAREKPRYRASLPFFA